MRSLCLSPESQGPNLALTVLYVPYSHSSGTIVSVVWLRAHLHMLAEGAVLSPPPPPYRGTSLIRKCTPLGPYRRPI